MRYVLNISEKLVPVVARILREREFPNDDGRTDADIMHDLQLSVAEYNQALRILDDLLDHLEDVSEAKC